MDLYKTVALEIQNPERFYYSLFAAGDDLSLDEHLNIFRFCWSGGNAHQQGIDMPDWLLEKVVENRVLLNNYAQIAMGYISPGQFSRMLQIIEMDEAQEREFWGFFQDLHPEFCHRGAYKIDELIGIFDLIGKSQRKNNVVDVLDLGCGPKGESIEQLYNIFQGTVRGAGVDKRITHYPESVQLEECCAQRLPFPDKMFDIIYSISMMPYLQRDKKERAIKEASRVLSPKGSLVFTDTEVDIEYVSGIASELGFRTSMREKAYHLHK